MQLLSLCIFEKNFSARLMGRISHRSTLYFLLRLALLPLRVGSGLSHLNPVLKLSSIKIFTT
jgi:hypothetical protein